MKLKSLLLIFALTLFAVSGLLAQDKYEYATVKYEPAGRSYFIYHSDLSGMKTETGKLAQNDSRFDFSAVIKYLDSLVNQGWEVFTITEYCAEHGGNYVTYHLRKKKSQ